MVKCMKGFSSVLLHTVVPSVTRVFRKYWNNYLDWADLLTQLDRQLLAVMLVHPCSVGYSTFYLKCPGCSKVRPTGL